MNDGYYDCSIAQTISGIATQHLLLYPDDYLYCETKEELEMQIKEDLEDSVDYGDICSDVLDSAYNIPEEFYEKWLELKKTYNE